MRIHFEWVWSQFMIGLLYDKRLNTTFVMVTFVMISIRLKKKKRIKNED